MVNLILVAGHLFMGQFNDMPSCKSAIRAIYFQQMAPYPEMLSKSELKEIGVALENTMKYQRKYICVPAKKG
jgi:hypothetical protein